MANADIGTMDVLNSCQKVLEDASYKRDGRISIYVKARNFIEHHQTQYKFDL